MSDFVCNLDVWGGLNNHTVDAIIEDIMDVAEKEGAEE